MWREKILEEARNQALIDNEDIDDVAEEVKVRGQKVRARG